MCSRFLVDDLSDTDNNLIAIENRHAAYRMRLVTGFVINFFIKSRVLLSKEKTFEKKQKKKKIFKFFSPSIDQSIEKEKKQCACAYVSMIAGSGCLQN